MTAPTLASSPVTRSAPAAGRPAGGMMAPGFVERSMAVLVLFIFHHQTPNVWFLTAGETGDLSNPLAALTQLGLIALLSMRILGHFDLLINVVKLEPLVFVFPALAMASVFWSADMNESLRRGVMLCAVTTFAAYLVIRYYLNEILGLFSAMFVASAGVNFVFIMIFPAYGIDRGGRWDAIFPQKNALGYIAALAIPTLLITIRALPRWRLAYYGALALHTLMLWMSQSKTMLVVAAGATSMIVVFHFFRARRTLRGAVIMSFAASSVLSILFATANLGLLAGWLDKDVTLTGRVPMWEALIPIAADRWVLGYGYQAAFGGLFSPVHEMLITRGNWNPSDSHNAVLQIVLELGVVGLVVFLGSYFRAVSRGIKVLATNQGPAPLWPLAIFAITTLVSIAESGLQSDPIGWCMYTVAVLSVAAGMKHAPMGDPPGAGMVEVGDGSDGPVIDRSTGERELI